MQQHKIAPRSLYIRFLLISVLPMVLVLIVATYMFYERHWSSMSRNMSSSLVGEIHYLIENFTRAPEGERNNVLSYARNYLGLDSEFMEGAELHNTHIDDEFGKLSERIQAGSGLPLAINRLVEKEKILAEIQIDGGVLAIKFSEKRLASSSTYIYLMWVFGAAGLFTIIAVLFLNNQVASIIRLAQAAESFGKGQDMPEFKPTGAKEVRRAAIAFIEMRERIKRLLTRRTQMLAGVSHDLRTPLTRMKLQLEMMGDDKNIADMKKDVVEMEEMLDGYLGFVRSEHGEGYEESSEKVILADFIQDILRGFDSNRVSCEIDGELEVNVKAGAFRRCLVNFIDNAIRYAEKVEVSAYRVNTGGADGVVIYIDDNGAGIPHDKHQEVFQPFYRLEQSRNKDTGGVGLGMSIARDIIHAHGGEVMLDTSPSGGLRVIITMPV